MKKDAKKQPVKGPEKKADEKVKVNYEEIIFNNLSSFKLNFDCSGYNYTKLDLSNKSLEVLTLAFTNHKYLESIDLSQNNIADFNNLANLPFLMRLNLEGNAIKDMKPLANEESFKSLKWLNLAKNKIVEMGPIKVAALQQLNLNDNRIEKFETFDGHPKLRVLELRRNKVGPLTVFVNVPELRELYLAENKVKSILGIETMGALQILHLRKNLIEVFDETFPVLENLQYINLRENKLDKFEEILKLNQLPQLKTLIFSNNNVTLKFPTYLLDTVNSFLKLSRVNKVYITKNLKLKAFKFSEDKWRKEQDAKAQAEADERAKELAAQQQDQ